MTPYQLGMRFVGIKEIAGQQDHPMIVWALTLCGFSPDAHDEVPWCSAWANLIAWLLRLPRSKSAMARSWLNVGVPVPLDQAVVGFDVVVLERGAAPAGHVGFYAGREGDRVLLLGGNQSDGVCVSSWPVQAVLGVRRLG